MSVASLESEVKDLLIAGKSDTEIQDLIGLTLGRLVKMKKSIFDKEIERLRAKPTEHTYVEYVLNQMGCVRDLTELYEASKKQNNANAGVGAIRARSDIFDKVIKVGQEFGILERKPEEKRIIAGIMVAQLSNDQLKSAITTQIGQLNEMVTQFGDLDITRLKPGQLHYTPSDTPTISTGKKNRSTANRNSGGRRVVKGPPV